jgi:multimeric flavodoxin WrbA
MYAVALNGSPRKNGNTSILLDNVLDTLKESGWETELVQVGGKRIRGCNACRKCWENKDMKCVFNDDIFNDVFQKIIRADAVIAGSPTYFAGTASEIKGLLDRTGYVSLANGRLLAGKIGAAVAAVRRGGATHVFDTINHMFLMCQMIVPGSTYWNIGVGHEKGDVEKDEEGLFNMKNLGQTINWLGRIMKENMESFPRVS